MSQAAMLERAEIRHELTAHQLEARIHASLGGRIRDLQVSLHEKYVVLRGWTKTFHAKQLAQHCVMSTVGRPLLNEIEVR